MNSAPSVKTADPVAQRAQLNNFVADRFQKNMTAKEAELTDSLKRYSLNTMQQYRTRYLLAKLTQFVDMAYKGLKTPGSLSDYTVLEIEHILPDRPTGALLSAFTAANPNSRYDDYKNKLGNLTLLEKPINIVGQQRLFQNEKGRVPQMQALPDQQYRGDRHGRTEHDNNSD
jgi:hypothetical protein